MISELGEIMVRSLPVPRIGGDVWEMLFSDHHLWLDRPSLYVLPRGDFDLTVSCVLVDQFGLFQRRLTFSQISVPLYRQLQVPSSSRRPPSVWYGPSFNF